MVTNLLQGCCYQSKTPPRTISEQEMIQEIASHQEIIWKKSLFWKVSPNGKCRSSSRGPLFSGGAAGVWLGELCRGILAQKQLLENKWEHLEEAQGHCRHLPRRRRRRRMRAGLSRGAGLAAPSSSQCGAVLGWAHPASAPCWSCRTSPASAEGHPKDLHLYICLDHIP